MTVLAASCLSPRCAKFNALEDHAGGTYRAVYTIRFEEAVFALHCFQKKSRVELQLRRKRSMCGEHSSPTYVVARTSRTRACHLS
ncbi:MAG TPA: type II toxin-antitoxin system RelE/ParE family toxin [Terracidiphilus sp.]